MSGMYGADVAQLRQLAGQFDRFAQDLDANRMTVGNAIQISAWAGPVAVRFRHEWDSAHSRRVAEAAERLRTAAGTLRANADQQERTSAVGSGLAPSLPNVTLPSLSLGLQGLAGASVAASMWSLNGVKSAWNGLRGASQVVGGLDLATSVADWANVAGRVIKTGTGGQSWTTLGAVMEGSRAAKVLGVAGTVLGGVSAGLGLVETVAKAADGDVGGAVWAGTKTAIGVAAMIPGPQQPFIAAVSIGISVGELAWEHRETIASVAKSAVDAGSRALSIVADSGASAIGAIGRTAAKLWPF